MGQRRLRWAFGVFAAVALIFLWQEHRAHLLGALPWLLLLACPLMHRFMHGGHHSATGGHRRGAETRRGEAQGLKPAENDRGDGCC
jgi:hypothetical protein